MNAQEIKNAVESEAGELQGREEEPQRINFEKLEDETSFIVRSQTGSKKVESYFPKSGKESKFEKQAIYSILEQRARRQLAIFQN